MSSDGPYWRASIPYCTSGIIFLVNCTLRWSEMPRESIPHCTPATIGLRQLPGHQMMAPEGRTFPRCW